MPATSEAIGLRGRLRLVTATGVERNVPNQVLQSGAELVAKLFSGQLTTPIDRISLGFGDGPLEPTDTALRPGTANPTTLRSPVAPDDCTVTIEGESVRISITATFTPTVVLREVTEAGLGAGDLLYNQVMFDPVTLDEDRPVSFFWEIDFPFGH